MKHNVVMYWDTLIPAPHSTLLKGLTLGIDDLKHVPAFKEYLVNTGTIHVAVVSGYNISLVLNICSNMLGNKVTLIRTIVFIVLSLLYSLLTGFEPPVIRAWLMSSVFLLGKLNGRVINKVHVLVIASIIMILCDNKIATSYSFLLSSGATLGLFLFAEPIKSIMSKYEKGRLGVFTEDLSSSLAASIIVCPIIAYAFSRISPYSPLINMLFLWIIPLSTIFGFLMVFTSLIDIYIHTMFTPLLLLFIYPFLDIFIKGISYFGKIPWISWIVSISMTHLVFYYVFILLILLFTKILSKDKSAT